MRAAVPGFTPPINTRAGRLGDSGKLARGLLVPTVGYNTGGWFVERGAVAEFDCSSPDRTAKIAFPPIGRMGGLFRLGPGK